ncbi:MAG: hypothetical protein EPO43_13320 [Rugosibacter sp.]|nr:MAG: hypothetical protein EPO43_13320 [Rugosibacter sp.]
MARLWRGRLRLAIPLALAAATLEWLEQLKPLGRFRRVFELAGSILLVLNAYFFFIPALAG